MPHFHTCFDSAPIKNKDKIYDRRDNVDRLSYVDNTRLVQRFINEGRSLNEARARAINSGLYLNHEDALNSNDDFVMPVFETDPAIMQPIIDKAKSDLKSRAAKRKNDTIKRDDMQRSSDLPDSSPNNESIKNTVNESGV